MRGRLRRALPDLWIAVLLCVLPLAFFGQVTLGDRTLLPADNLYQFQPWASYRARVGGAPVPDVPHNMLLSDLVLENLQWKRFMRQSVAAGEIPLWNPYLFAGVPFLAAGQHSALYPFSLIYYALPLEKAFGWFTVSQLALAGLFMYALMRGLGIGRAGALISAIAYQFSSFLIASVVFQMILAAAAWLPFLLLMVEFTLQRRPLLGKPAYLPWVALGALGLGMCILAGHIEFVYYALLVMGFWSAWRLLGLLRRAGLREALRPTLLRPAFALIALVSLGLGAGAVQFVPLVELANASSREGRSTFEQVRGYAFPPRQALALLMPNFFGSPAQHDYFDVFTGQQTALRWTRPDGATVTDTMLPGGKNYVEGAWYVGILTLALAAVALVNMRERAPRARIATHGPYRAIFVALAGVSLLFIFGTVFYGVLYYGLPGFNQLHSPFRWVYPFTLCMAALAGFGAEALTRAREAASDLPCLTRRFAKGFSYALMAVGGAILGGLMLSRALFDSLREPIAALYRGLAGADLVFPTVEAFYSFQFRNVLLFGVFVIAAGAVIGLSGLRRPIWRIVWQIAASVVLALDLMVAVAGFNPAADPRWLDFEPPAIAWLREQRPAEWRLTAVQGPTATLNANTPWLYGLQDIRGYDSIIPRRYVEYMGQIAPQDQLLYNRIAPLYAHTLAALDSPYLHLLGARYIAVEAQNQAVIDALAAPDYAHLRLAYQDEALRIYENTRALPRAFLVGAATGDLPPIEAIRPMPDSRAQIDHAGNIELRITVDAPRAGTLIVADSYATGWRAYVRPVGAAEDAETEVALAPAYGNFRAVALPAGQWLVRMRYSPPSFQVGAFGTFMSLAALLFAGLVWAWGAFYRETGPDPTATGARRFAKNSLAPIALNLFNRAIDFAFAAIMLRLLGPASAGTYYYAVVIFGWFDILTNFGLNTLLTREVARDRASAGRYLLNSSLLRLGLAGAGVPLLVGFLLVRGSLQPPLDGTALLAIVLLYIGLVPGSISTGLSALFYAFEKAEIPAAISTVTAMLKALLGLAALLAGWGVIGLAAVSIVLNGITLGLLAWGARAGLREAGGDSAATAAPRPDPALMRAMLGAGWPLMLNHLLATLFFKIDVVILEPLQGAAVVGQYSTAYKWVDALGVIPALFTMALLPILSRLAATDKPALERSYHFAVKLLFGLALPVSVMTTFLAYPLVYLLGGARFLPDGAIALQLMIWFAPIGWINSLTNYVLIALDQQRRMRWVFLAGVSFNIVVNLLFVPVFSYRASAVATIFSELVLLVGFYLLLRRALAPVDWPRLLWKPALAALVMAGLMLALWPIAPLLALAAGPVAYGGLLIGLRWFSDWERSRLAPLLPGPLRRLA